MTQTPSTQEMTEESHRVTESQLNIPHFIVEIGKTVAAANELATEDNIGHIETEVVRPRENLTCIKASFVDSDGVRQESFYLSKVKLIEQSGPRSWIRRGIRIQNVDTNNSILISDNPETLLAILSF